MTNVTKIKGVAGAGKSTQMCKLTDDLRDDGYTAADFQWLSFSRSHASDLAEDINDAWSGAGDPTDNVSTLHSLCVDLVEPEQIITVESDADVFEEAWDGHPLDFDPDELANATRIDEDKPRSQNTTTQIHRAEEQLAVRGAFVDGWGLNADARGMSCTDVNTGLETSVELKLIEEWREAKEENDLYQHHDYVCEAFDRGLVPDCDVLMVDEMQDMAPIEAALVVMWIGDGDIDEVVLAGDGNQTIYGFKGAKAKYFEDDIECDEVVELTETYRCPPEVCRVAQRVLPESQITPVKGDDGPDSGSVFASDCRDKYQVAKLAEMLLNTHETPYDTETQVAFLSRTNRQAGKIQWAFRETGIMYQEPDGTSPWTNKVTSVVNALRTPESVTQTQQRHLSDMLPERLESTTGEVNLLNKFDSVDEIVSRLEIADWKRTMIDEARKRGKQSRTQIDVGTIHAYKGRQASAVVVSDAYSNNLKKMYRSDSDFRKSEDRLGYVAATRASDTLIRLDRFFESGSFRPFDGVIEQVSKQTRSNNNRTVNADD